MPTGFLRRVGEILRSSDSIEERLRKTVDEIGAFMAGSPVSALLFDRDTGDFFLRATTLKLSTAVTAWQYAAPGTLEELALNEQRPLCLVDSARPAGSMMRGDAFIFPMISGGEPLGVLQVQSVTEQGVPGERVTAVREAAALLADAVRVSLREESAALRMTRIAAINEAGVNLISTLDLSRLLRLVATSACLVMEAECCVIRLLDPVSGKYVIRDFHGAKEGAEQKDLLRLDTRAVTAVLKGAPSVIVREMAEDPAWKEFSGAARTMVCLPLRGNKGILGTISLFDKFPHKTFYPCAFNADDLDTFVKYVRYVERAIGNAIAFEKNEKLRNLDETTGMPTLSYFQGRLLHEIARGRRFKRRLVLMICEVVPAMPDGQSETAADRGDWVIRRISRVLRAALREYDVVARISEWKFGMILPEAEDGKVSAIPRIRRAISGEVEDIRTKMRDVRVDVRFGHASFPEDGEDHEKLIFKANILKV